MLTRQDDQSTWEPVHRSSGDDNILTQARSIVQGRLSIFGV